MGWVDRQRVGRLIEYGIGGAIGGAAHRDGEGGRKGKEGRGRLLVITVIAICFQCHVLAFKIYIRHPISNISFHCMMYGMWKKK